MYKGLCNIYRAEDLKERKNCEHHTECCKSCQDFDFSVGFQLLVFQHWHLRNPWLPLNLSKSWKKKKKAATAVRHSALSFLSIPKPSPFVSFSAKKTSPLDVLSSRSGPNLLALHETAIQLASWRGGVMKTNDLGKPWIMCVTIKGEGWCGSLLGSHKPLVVMEEVRADLYTQM